MCPAKVRQAPEESRTTKRPKRCGNNNKHEDNCLKALNDKNHQVSSHKFRQLSIGLFGILTKCLYLLKLTSSSLILSALLLNCLLSSSIFQSKSGSSPNSLQSLSENSLHGLIHQLINILPFRNVVYYFLLWL